VVFVEVLEDGVLDLPVDEVPGDGRIERGRL
jgi:hypothetical protein